MRATERPPGTLGNLNLVVLAVLSTLTAFVALCRRG